jgi:hypothetical protein
VSASGVRSEIFPVSVSADCDATSIRFSVASSSGKTVSGSSISVPVVTRNSLFTSLSDLSDNDLFVFARDSAASANGLLDSSRALISSSGATQKEKLSGLALSYRAANLSFRSNDAFSLIRARENMRYSVPVAGKSIPTEYPFIPGAGRPYRKDTTDGIHHGWDIMAAV